MSVRESLYSILGIKRDATDAEVKKAFRERSNETHPDKGGDKDAFQLVCIAGQVLRDRRRRAEYDKTGAYEDGPEPKSRAEQLVVDAFFTIFATLDETELLCTDIIKRVRQHLNNKIQENETNIALWKKNRRLQEKVIKKIHFNKKPKGTGLLLRALEDNIDALIRDVRKAESFIEELNEAIELSEEYSYEPDDMPQASVRFPHTSGTNSSWL